MKRKWLAGLLFAAILSVMATPIAAESEGVVFAAKPEVQSTETGEDFRVSISCDKNDNETGVAVLTLEVPDMFLLQKVCAGQDIQESELSYNYINGQLILLYVDGEGGASSLKQGQELAVVTLVAEKPGSAQPLMFVATDASALNNKRNVYTQKSSGYSVGIEVTGAIIVLPTVAPTYREPGEKDMSETLLEDDKIPRTDNTSGQQERSENDTTYVDVIEPQQTPSTVPEEEEITIRSESKAASKAAENSVEDATKVDAQTKSILPGKLLTKTDRRFSGWHSIVYLIVVIALIAGIACIVHKHK